jgi:hypothetical protein
MVCAANVQVGRSWSTSPLRNGNQTRPKPEAIPKYPLGVAGGRKSEYSARSSCADYLA